MPICGSLRKFQAPLKFLDVINSCLMECLLGSHLDEIIKLNRKAKKASGPKPSAKSRLLAVKRAGLLRSSLVKPMKSRQVTAARAIFQRARRTAAIAARVAADAAALVSPANTAIQGTRRIGGK